MKRRLPPLTAMRSFEAAARYESLTKAAEELGVTQSAVSKQVSILEDYLGKQLFIRKQRSLEITDEGRFYSQAISACFDSLANKLLEPADSDRQKITILADADFTQLWLFSRLPEFEKRYPNIEISINSVSDLSVINKGDTFDLAVVWGRGDWDRFSFEPLFTNVVFPVCAPGYFSQEKLEAGRFHEVNLIHNRSRHWWTMFVNLLGQNTIYAKKGQIFNQTSLCLAAAARGGGMTTGAEVTARQFLEDGSLIIPFAVRLPSPDSYYILAPRNEGFSTEPIRLLKDWLITEANKHRNWFAQYWNDSAK
ncbi:MAG: LysR substrate-binding domain-containing protein [Gammaproteobacteria bacterium]|nr:LysR substrate-binding domain-containing protein [Gammaproteobacteria bacterium]